MNLPFVGRVTTQPDAVALPLCTFCDVPIFVDGIGYNKVDSETLVAAWIVAEASSESTAKSPKATPTVKPVMLAVEKSNFVFTFSYQELMFKKEHKVPVTVFQLTTNGVKTDGKSDAAAFVRPHIEQLDFAKEQHVTAKKLKTSRAPAGVDVHKELVKDPEWKFCSHLFK